MATQRIADFDTWRPGYAGSLVTVYVAGTTTLADVFLDEALTSAADNPITLASQQSGDVSYGKWPHAGSLYTAQAVELSIDSTDRTGVTRPPLTTVAGENASAALVTATGGSVAHTLADVVARMFHATDYGALVAGGGSAASNNATLLAALGAAAGAGGGIVQVPAGTYAFTALSIAGGCVLQGQGRGVTILQCQTANRCVTMAGDRAGLRAITIDGVNNTASSTGVYGKARSELLFDDVDIKRFAIGLHFKGGRKLNARNLYLTNNTNGAKLYGDDDAGGGADGDAFMFNEWSGGAVTQTSGIGIDLSFEDMACWHNVFRDIGFEDNTGTAVRVNGARWVRLESCWWTGNTINLDVLDDSDASAAARLLNTIESLQIIGGEMSEGAVNLRDTLLDVAFIEMRFSEVAFTLTSPLYSVLLRDCNESLVTVAGTASYLNRWYKNDHGATTGLTTDATVTKAWARTLEPGEVVYLLGRVIGNQRNGTGVGGYWIAVTAKRAGSTLLYDAQSANFTVGDVLTGATSGATARIIADSDGGTTGTLTLRDIDGAFIDNEVITGSSGGSALANGALVAGSVALLGSVADVRTAYEDDSAWAATFAANGPEIELRVTGAAAKTIEWTCDVDVTTSL
ncbi:hypothetical protein [Ferrovibrio terrae]|uniref:hypothetical protein n=1 Tax=Ferrovibrio terrae TaxID=2594003 RepID=UPI0031383761